MTQIDRKQKILDELAAKGSVNIPELSQRLEVSDMTIRRDLMKLAQQGVVTLERGGAVLNGGSLLEYTVPVKQGVRTNDKKRIAQRCAEMAREGDSVFLDAGTTVAEIARRLAHRSNITILTNSLLAANFLSASPNKVIMCPGEFRQTSMAFMGPMTDEFIRQFKIDLLFLGVEGVDIKNGLTVPNTTDGMTKRALVQSAIKTVCAADSGKVGLTFLYQLCPVSAIDMLVTDMSLSESCAEQFAECDVDICRV